MSIKKRFFIVIQYLIPQHGLSRLVGFLAETKIVWLKNILINTFVKHYKVDMAEAIHQKAEDYQNFNDFFTRSLKVGTRAVNEDTKVITSPVDGAISQIGTVKDGRIVQAKGHDYSVVELLGGDEKRAAPFAGGEFTTIYLSPRDYHRIHMPVSGVLKEMIYVPGDLFSVNHTTAEGVSNLFARNERVVCLFDTAYGSMAIVLVGAMIVASIETVWAGLVTPPKRVLISVRYDDHARKEILLTKGDELGRFKLGSTVIMLFESNKITWERQLGALSNVRMGQKLAMSNS